MSKDSVGYPKAPSHKSMMETYRRQHVYVPPPFPYNQTCDIAKQLHVPPPPPPILLKREGIRTNTLSLSIVVSIIVYILAIVVVVYRR